MKNPVGAVFEVIGLAQGKPGAERKRLNEIGDNLLGEALAAIAKSANASDYIVGKSKELGKYFEAFIPGYGRVRFCGKIAAKITEEEPLSIDDLQGITDEQKDIIQRGLRPGLSGMPDKQQPVGQQHNSSYIDADGAPEPRTIAPSAGDSHGHDRQIQKQSESRQGTGIDHDETMQPGSSGRPDEQQPFGQHHDFPYIDADSVPDPRTIAPGAGDSQGHDHHIQQQSESRQGAGIDHDETMQPGSSGRSYEQQSFGQHHDFPYIDTDSVPDLRTVTPGAGSLHERDLQIQKQHNLRNIPDPESADFSAYLDGLVSHVKKETGIVSSDLIKLQKISYKYNTIISIRPVDKFATGLIESGYETKGFHIKGKSASWGPQAGLISADQHFSKLENAAAERINKFNAAIEKSIQAHNAVKVPLVLSLNRLEILTQWGTISAMSKPDENGVRTFAATAPSGKQYQFEATPTKNAGEKLFSITSEHKQIEVLAPSSEAKPFTADYDLLVIGPHISDLGPQDNLPVSDVAHSVFTQKIDSYNNLKGINPNLQDAYNSPEIFYRNEDPDIGNASQRIRNLIPVINNEIMMNGNVQRAKVVHHSADSGNPVTEPGANYPATFLLPFKMGSFDEITVIHNPNEFKDLVQQAKDHGYHIPLNPLWESEVKNVRRPNFTTATHSLGRAEKSAVRKSGRGKASDEPKPSTSREGDSGSPQRSESGSDTFDSENSQHSQVGSDAFDSEKSQASPSSSDGTSEASSMLEDVDPLRNTPPPMNREPINDLSLDSFIHEAYLSRIMNTHEGESDFSNITYRDQRGNDVNYNFPIRPATSFRPVIHATPLTEEQVQVHIDHSTTRAFGATNLQLYTLRAARNEGSPEIQRMTAIASSAISEVETIITQLTRLFSEPQSRELLRQRLQVILETNDGAILNEAMNYIETSVHKINQIMRTHRDEEYKNIYVYGALQRENVLDREEAFTVDAFTIVGDSSHRVFFNAEASISRYENDGGLVRELETRRTIHAPPTDYTRVTLMHELTHLSNNTEDYIYVRNTDGSWRYASAPEALKQFKEAAHEGKTDDTLYLEVIGKEPQFRQTYYRTLSSVEKGIAQSILQRDPMLTTNIMLNNADNLAIAMHDLYRTVAPLHRNRRSVNELRSIEVLALILKSI